MSTPRGDLDFNDQSIRGALNCKSRHQYEAHRVEPLLPEHLDNAFESIEAAFKGDPPSQYIEAGRERSSTEQKAYKRLWKLYYKRLLKRKIAYAVDSGDAVIIATPPDEDLCGFSPVHRTVDFITSAVWNSFTRIHRHREQAKRLKELEVKMTEIVEDNLGDRTQSMVYIGLLATKPELQRRGYGAALLRTVLFSADKQSRAVFLINGNVLNTPFYEAFGFAEIGNFSLGEGNLKWDKPPIVISLMVREAKNGALTSKAFR